MPGQSYQRRPLEVSITPSRTGGAWITFGGRRTRLGAQHLERLSQGRVTLEEMVPHGRVLRQLRREVRVTSHERPETLLRVDLFIDEELRGLPWEAVFRPGVFPAPVMRCSDVRPRVLDQAMTLPMRLLQVDIPIGEREISSFELSAAWDHLTDSRAVRHALRYHRTTPESVEEFRQRAQWPGVDVVHVTGAGYALTSLTEEQRDPFSSGLWRESGSFAWLERLCVEARVRLLALEGTTEDERVLLRRLAGMLVDRGGPPVLIISDPEHAGVAALYDLMLRDVPLDVALRRVPDVDVSVVIGCGATDLLRPSNVEERIRELATDISSGGLVAGFLRHSLPGIRPELIVDEEHGIGWFAHNNLSYDHLYGGMIPLGAILDDVRQLTNLGVLNDEGGVRKPADERLWEQPDAEREARYLNTALWTKLDERLVQDTDAPVSGRHYQVSIDIGSPDPTASPVGGLAILEEVFSWEAGQAGVWAEVCVTSLGLDVVGSAVQQVWIPRTGPSQRLFFTVTPTEAGVQAVRVCLYVEQNVVQSVKLAARCVARSGGAVPPVKELARVLRSPDDALGDVTWATSVEYALHGLDAETAASTVSLVMNDHRGLNVTTVKGEDHFEVHVATDLSNYVEAVRQALESVAAPKKRDGTRSGYAFNARNQGSEAWFDHSMERLARVGWQMFVEVFKHNREGLQDLLHEDNGRISVAHVLLDKVIPWAAVYDREYQPTLKADAEGNPLRKGVCHAGLPRDNGTFPAMGCGELDGCLLRERFYSKSTVVCPRHFWGFRHLIQLPAQQGVGGLPPTNVDEKVRAGGRPLMTVGMHGGLDLIDQHYDDLTRAASEASRQASVEQARFVRDEVVWDLRRTDQDIVYLYCHAEGGGSNTNPPRLRVRRRRAQWELTDPAAEAPIEPADVTGSRWSNSPLIVMNGCRTAAFRPDALSKFIAEFVWSRQAGGVLATEISVFELLAAEVGTKFVRDFLDGKSAGQSLLAIRRDLLHRLNPLGLAYTLYATTDFHLGSDELPFRTIEYTSISTPGGVGETVEEQEPELVDA